LSLRRLTDSHGRCLMVATRFARLRRACDRSGDYAAGDDYHQV
jgi:hypothetical protein